jgi:hypothetical protein
MQYWPFVDRREPIPTFLDHEFSNRRVNAVRQRSLNFELEPEPRLTTVELPKSAPSLRDSHRDLDSN